MRLTQQVLFDDDDDDNVNIQVPFIYQGFH